MNVNASQISPEEWSNWLKEATSQTGRNHQYIVLQGRANNQTYALLRKSDFGPGTRRLSIGEIQKISKEKIAQLALQSQVNLSTSKSVRQFTETALEIGKQNERLIQFRQKKENRTINRIFRGIELVISSVFSFFGWKLNLPSEETKALKRQLQGIKQEIKRLKVENDNLDAGVLREVIDSQILEESPEIVAELLKVKENLPDLIDQMLKLKKEVRELGDKPISENLEAEYQLAEEGLKGYVEDILSTVKELHWSVKEAAEFVARKQFFALDSIPKMNDSEIPGKYSAIIQGTYEDDLRTSESKFMLNQFKKDLSRMGVSFLRKDQYLGILDHDPIPNKAPFEKRLETAAASLSEIIEQSPPSDVRWLPILQLAANQSALNAAFLFPSGILAEQFLTNYSSAAGGESPFLFKAAFPNGMPPPIRLEIIRNENTHEIEKIRVTIEGQLDLIKNDEEGVIIPGIIKGALNYDIILGESNQPIIQDLECRYTTTIPELL